MNLFNHRYYNTFIWLSLICALIPIIIFLLWLKAVNLGESQLERVEIFHSYFPEMLRGRWSTTILSILFCILAIFFAALGVHTTSKLLKILAVILLILSSPLLLLNIFSLL